MLESSNNEVNIEVATTAHESVSHTALQPLKVKKVFETMAMPKKATKVTIERPKRTTSVIFCS